MKGLMGYARLPNLAFSTSFLGLDLAIQTSNIMVRDYDPALLLFLLKQNEIVSVIQSEELNKFKS
jgi:hypothetical protein